MDILSDTVHGSDTSLNRDLVIELDLIIDFDLITIFWEVSIEHLQRVRLANRGRLLLRIPGLVQFGTCIFLMLRPFFPELVIFRDFKFRISLGTPFFFCLKQ